MLAVFVQQFQQLTFPERQFFLLRITGQSLPVRIKNIFTHPYLVLLLRILHLTIAVTQSSLHTYNKFFHAKRLAYIVIGAFIKPFYQVGGLSFGS